MDDPLDPDRLDAIEGACESLPVLAMPKAEVLALVAAAREAEELRIAIHGCGCPAPYDQCPHDEPYLLAEKRLRAERDALRAEVERLREWLTEIAADHEPEPLVGTQDRSWCRCGNWAPYNCTAQMARDALAGERLGGEQ